MSGVQRAVSTDAFVSTRLVTLDPLLFRRYAFRALPLWLIVHVAIIWASRGETFILSPLATGGFAVLAAVVGVIDAHHRHELLFLQNLGIHPAFIGVTSAVTIIGAEVSAATLIATLYRPL